MQIQKDILERCNVFEGEEITEGVDELYEFLSSEYYDLIRVKVINWGYSSLDLVNYIQPIIGKEFSHLDLKYCMALLEIKSQGGLSRNKDGTYSDNGILYYAIREEWCRRIKRRLIKEKYK